MPVPGLLRLFTSFLLLLRFLLLRAVGGEGCSVAACLEILAGTHLCPGLWLALRSPDPVLSHTGWRSGYPVGVEGVAVVAETAEERVSLLLAKPNSSVSFIPCLSRCLPNSHTGSSNWCPSAWLFWNDRGGSGALAPGERIGSSQMFLQADISVCRFEDDSWT